MDILCGGESGEGRGPGGGDAYEEEDDRGKEGVAGHGVDGDEEAEEEGRVGRVGRGRVGRRQYIAVYHLRAIG